MSLFLWVSLTRTDLSAFGNHLGNPKWDPIVKIFILKYTLYHIKMIFTGSRNQQTDMVCGVVRVEYPPFSLPLCGQRLQRTAALGPFDPRESFSSLMRSHLSFRGVKTCCMLSQCSCCYKECIGSGVGDKRQQEAQTETLLIWKCGSRASLIFS